MDRLRHSPVVGDALRTELMFFMVWSLVRDVAQRIVEQCVEGRQGTGMGDGGFSVPGLEGGIRWDVAVMGARNQREVDRFVRRPAAEMRRAVEWGQRPGWTRTRGLVYPYDRMLFSV